MKTIHLILGLALTLDASAQQWCVPGATWHYSTIWTPNDFYKYTYTGDTIIGGVTGNVIQWSITNDPNPLIHITRAENDVVYEFQDFPAWGISRWDTIIWFGATPGDSWGRLDPIDWSGCSCPFNVIDTGHVMIDGQWLRSLEVSNPCFNGGWHYRYVERFGSDYGLFFDRCEDTEFNHEPLMRCYSDEGMNYETDVAPSCEWGVGIHGYDVLATWSIHPAGEGSIQIRGLEARSGESLRFVDSSGRVAMTSTVNLGNAIVDVSPLAPGPYIVQPGTSPELAPLRWMKY